MFFNLKVWFCALFDMKSRPLCRVWNNVRTEHYTLLNDGWIIIASPRCGVKDKVFITLASEDLLNSFTAELVKIRLKNGDIKN